MSAQTFSSTQVAAVSPRVNLLPPEIAERNALRKAQYLMVGTGLAAVAVVGVMYVQASAKVSSAQHEKTAAAADSQRLTGQLNALQNVRDTYAQVDAANRTLATAMHYDVHWSTYLQDLTLTIPENVWLESMNAKVNAASVGAGATGAAGADQVLDPGLGTVTFTGDGFVHDDVAAWLESLGKEKGYTNPYYTDSHEFDAGGGRIAVKFTSTVTLTEKALSNTYAKGLER